jgi:glutathione S-transferase
MINNGVGFFPPPPPPLPPYGSARIFCCEPWIPPTFYNSTYQQQQQQIKNGQNNEDWSLFKLYDLDGNNQNEIIRLIFAFMGISFKDKRIKQDEWERVKNRMPIQQLPILRVNNQMRIYYLNSIVRYLARGFHLYGTGNDDQAIVDMIFEFNYEFQKKLFEEINNSIDIEQRKLILNQFLTDYGINHFNQLEKFYQIFNRQGLFYLGSQISLADLIVYQTINYFVDIQSTLLDNYPRLQQAYQQLEKQFQLINYSNKKETKIKKKRHRTVPPTERHVDRHHRHRSYEQTKPSHRHHSSESSSLSQQKEEFKSSDNQLQENELNPPLQTNEEPKPPDHQSKENESEPSLQTKQEPTASTSVISEDKSEHTIDH